MSDTTPSAWWRVAAGEQRRRAATDVRPRRGPPGDGDTPGGGRRAGGDVPGSRSSAPRWWSARWLDGATGPETGARFAARNGFSRGPAVGNEPVITAVEPGRRISWSWSRTEPFGATVEGTHDFRPHPEGTEMVESYRTTKPASRSGSWIIGTVPSRDRRSGQRAGVEQTLQHLEAHVGAAPKQ